MPDFSPKRLSAARARRPAVILPPPVARAMGAARWTLRTLFNLKAMAVSTAVTVSAAMALPFLETADGRAGNAPRAAAPAHMTADIPGLPLVATDVMHVCPDGTAVIDGFRGCMIGLPGRHGDSVLGGPGTVLIHAHGGGKGEYYSLTPDARATARFNGPELDRILTALNPETVILMSCNPHGAMPEDLSRRIRLPEEDKRLKTVIMAAPGNLMIFFPDVPVLTSYESPLGRTLFGYSNDWGHLLGPVRAAEELFDGAQPSGGLLRYERIDGAWVNRGAYKADNRFDLIDPLPLGCIFDACATLYRGRAAYDELHEINGRGNSLSYWDKVSRNLAKPVASTTLALSMTASAAAGVLWKAAP